MGLSNKIIFISDCHITTSAPFRVGDPLLDVLSKLDYVIEFANSNDAVIVIGGDIFDKSTIPYEAYTAVCETLRKAKYTPWAIKGNHDQLFRCDDNDRKTTLYNAFKLGVLCELKEPVDFGEFILTPDKSLINRDKPQILVYHGFLNVKDGKYTVFIDDLAGVTTPTLVLLGHDHVEYEPVTLGACTVYRIGSLFRNRRVETSDRNPKMLYVEVSDGKFIPEVLEVPAKPATEIFRETVGKSDKVEESDYVALISELKRVNGEDVDLLSVVSKIAEARVCEYIESMLNESKIKNVH
jgi:DNA repair exonuclease SbcCD nuclease subunit